MSLRGKNISWDLVVVDLERIKRECVCVWEGAGVVRDVWIEKGRLRLGEYLKEEKSKSSEDES